MARACRRYPRALLVVQTAYFWQPLGKTWQICGVWTKYALSLEGLILATWENAGEKPEMIAGCCPYRSYLPCLSFRVANLSDLDYLRRGSVENGCAFCPEWPALCPKRPCSSARTTRPALGGRPAPDGGPSARTTAPQLRTAPCARTTALQRQMAAPALGRLRPNCERPPLHQDDRIPAPGGSPCVRAPALPLRMAGPASGEWPPEVSALQSRLPHSRASMVSDSRLQVPRPGWFAPFPMGAQQKGAVAFIIVQS